MSLSDNVVGASEILVGLGANLDHPIYGPPIETLKAAIIQMQSVGIIIEAQASWYKSAPVPVSDQPWFVNTVVAVGFPGSALELLAALHKIEDSFGRVRQKRWEARLIDLDLLCYRQDVTVNRDQGQGMVLPHPHMSSRAFVMRPIAEIMPGWRHPTSGESAENIIAQLDPAQHLEIIPA